MSRARRTAGSHPSVTGLAVRWLLLGALAAPFLALGAPAAAGYRSFTVLSGSMAPAIASGDVVVTRPVRAEAVRPADIVTFRDPTMPERLLTHRVLGVRAEQGRLVVQTQGDANATPEQWVIPPDGRVGRVAYVVRRAGFVAQPLAAPVGRLVGVALPAAVLSVLLVVWAWQPRPVRVR